MTIHKRDCMVSQGVVGEGVELPEKPTKGLVVSINNRYNVEIRCQFINLETY